MLKPLFTLVLCLLPAFFLAQNFSITEGFISTCSGTIFDSGGQGGSGYSNNENYTLTICPDNANDIISLEFLNFALDTTNGDTLTIYDGNTTNGESLGSYTSTQLQGNVITSTSLNSSGCLTIVFASDSTIVGSFAATISCSASCQRPFAQASSTPDTIANICIGESISFNGSTSFAQSGLNVVDYHWDFDDGVIDSLSGVATSYSYNEPGIYNVQLFVIDDNNCISSNLTDLSIWVAPTPVFNPMDLDSSICLGESSTMVAYPDQYAQTWTSTPDFHLGGAASIPDQVGQCFQSGLEYTSFNPGQTITNINDILDICVNIEHSFMGDLVISLICPNGQSVVLHQQGGGGTDLGDPINQTGIPGVGWDYCWSPTASNGTWVDNSTTNTMPNNNGGQSLIPDTYESLNPMSALVGCELNGTWELEFCDLWGGDDGYIFNWEINFANILYTTLDSITPTIGAASDSSSWSGMNIINTSTDGNEITVTPTTAGTHNYVYSVTNDFGCTSDTTIILVVDPVPQIYAGADTSACSGGQIQLNGVNINAPPSVDTCIYELILTDTWGDGWNGASVDVLINGIATNYGMSMGSDTSYYFTLNDSDSLEIVFNSGTFNAECIYTITDCDSTQIFTDGPSPNTGTVFTSVYGNSYSYVYQWSPSTGLSDTTILDPVTSIAGQIDYVLSAYPTGHPLCLSMDTVNIVFDSLLPVVNLGLDTSFCEDTLILNVGQFGGVYLWNDSSQDSIMIIESTGLYWVEVALGACTQTDSIQVFVASSPSIELGTDTSININQTLIINSIPGYSSYVWQDTIIGGFSYIVNPQVLGVGTHQITLEVTNSDGCSAYDSIYVTIDDNTIVTEFNLNNVKIYPNPSSDVINLSSNSKILSARVFNSIGSEVEITIENNTINVSKLPAGSYYLLLYTETGDKTITLIIN